MTGANMDGPDAAPPGLGTDFGGLPLPGKPTPGRRGHSQQHGLASWLGGVAGRGSASLRVTDHEVLPPQSVVGVSVWLVETGEAGNCQQAGAYVVADERPGEDLAGLAAEEELHDGH